MAVSGTHLLKIAKREFSCSLELVNKSNLAL